MNAHDVGQWVGDHKVAAGGVVAGTLLLFLYLRHRSSAGSTAGATTSSAGQADASFAVPDTSYATDTTTTDPTSLLGAGDLANAILGLTASVNNLTPVVGGNLTTGGTVNDGSAAGSTPTTPAGTPPVGATTGATSSPAHTTVTGVVRPKIVRPVVKPKAGKPAPATHTYTVRSGDNLSAIASRLHIKGGWQTLYAENRKAVGSNPNLIHPGLVLHY